MPNRRSILLQLAATGLLINIPGVIRNALAAGNNPITPGIYKITGTVTVNGQSAREGMLIKVGDTVITGPQSEAIYVVGQDAFLQHDNSTIHLLGESTLSILRIIRGRLLSVFGKGSKKIETRTATIGIRGTGCYIEAETAQTYICLCYGEADFVPNIAPEKSTRLKTTHHESPRWISGENKEAPISEAPMINHTDAELALLEGLTGRTPAFYGKPY